MEVGGSAYTILGVGIGFEDSGEISYVEVCLKPVPPLERAVLESVLRLGKEVRIVLRDKTFGVTCSGYTLRSRQIEDGRLCYIFSGGRYAFNGV